MGIETNREIAGTETGLSVSSRVGESGCCNLRVRTTDVASSQQPRRMETDNGLAPLTVVDKWICTLLYVNSLQPCW
jgi:hypothetical protein